jgi:hypothetical protein
MERRNEAGVQPWPHPQERHCPVVGMPDLRGGGSISRGSHHTEESQQTQYWGRARNNVRTGPGKQLNTDNLVFATFA